MCSLRRTSRFEIANHAKCSEASKLKKIIQHFAIHVEKLKFSRDDKNIMITDFEYIMRSMINVMEVTFDGLNIYGNPKKLAENPIPLPKLKKLVLEHCDEESMEIMLRLVKASSLEDVHVHIHNDDVFDFTPFFMVHKTIKRVTMSGQLQHGNAFKQLELTNLQIYNDGNDFFLRDVIGHQPKLKYLNLLFHDELPYGLDEEDDDPKPIVNDELFKVICTLTELETLKIGIGQLSSDAIAGIVNLVNLKELVLKPVGSNDYSDYDNDYDYDINQKRQRVNYRKIFRKLIAIKLLNLTSFTWSFGNDMNSYEFFDSDQEDCASDEEHFMGAAHRREFEDLGKINIIKTMAPCFPNLKYLKIKMANSDDNVNVRDILELLPHLETLQLKMDCSFEGAPIELHEQIKHMKISNIEPNSLIEMMQLMPNLLSLEIVNTKFSLNKILLQNLQAAVPKSLKSLKLNLNSRNYKDFDVDNIKILQEILKNIQKCDIKLTGSANFDRVSNMIDRSIDPNLGRSMPRSPKGYYPGDDYENHESYLKLWKSGY